jgi:hypothetical protein
MNGRPAAEPLRIGAFAPLFIDIFAPLAVYTVLSRLGASDLVSLGAAALLPALYVVVAAIRGRRIDRLAALVLALLALAIVLTLATGDPRILLAKSVIVTGSAGVYFLATLLAERPFIFHASQKLFAGREPGGEAVWDERWRSSPAFRRAMRLLTVIWGAGLIGEAAVRAWIIYTLPVSQSVVWGQLWAIACLIGLVVLSLRIGRRTREIVRAEIRGQP